MDVEELVATNLGHGKRLDGRPRDTRHGHVIWRVHDVDGEQNGEHGARERKEPVEQAAQDGHVRRGVAADVVCVK